MLYISIIILDCSPELWAFLITSPFLCLSLPIFFPLMHQVNLMIPSLRGPNYCVHNQKMKQEELLDIVSHEQLVLGLLHSTMVILILHKDPPWNSRTSLKLCKLELFRIHPKEWCIPLINKPVISGFFFALNLLYYKCFTRNCSFLLLKQHKRLCLLPLALSL